MCIWGLSGEYGRRGRVGDFEFEVPLEYYCTDWWPDMEWQRRHIQNGCQQVNVLHTGLRESWGQGGPLMKGSPLAQSSHSRNNCNEKTERKFILESLKKRWIKNQQPDCYRHIVTLRRNFRQSQGRFHSLFLWKIYEAQIGENVLIVLSLAFLSWNAVSK